jgi:transposase
VNRHRDSRESRLVDGARVVPFERVDGARGWADLCLSAVETAEGLWYVADGVDAPTAAVVPSCAEKGLQKKETIPMDNAAIIGVDLAKNVFQIHGARADGSVAFRLKLTRAKFLAFFEAAPRCVVVMEACGSAHHWGRRIHELGHEVRLIAPNYVKPFVKRQKNDAADAEAIVEAALRPTMRFVSVKPEEKQAASMVFKMRDLLVRQKTQAINALRGHMMEYGIVAPSGAAHVVQLERALDDPGAGVPADVVGLCRMLLKLIAELRMRIAELDRDLRDRARRDAVASRLTTIPGIGPVTAFALQTLSPTAPTFSKGRDFSAWIGLTPRQNSSGGKERLGKTSKMGQRDLRRLLVICASSIVRWAIRRPGHGGAWLAQMLARKPRQLATVALANRMARIAWALMSKGGTYRASEVAAA